MRLSPTVLAFIAASGLVGLSSSQAKANPWSDVQTNSTTEQDQNQGNTSLVGEAVASLPEAMTVAQPLTLQAAQEANGSGAEALAPMPVAADEASAASGGSF